MAKQRDWEADHFNNVEAFTQRIRLLYYAAIREAVRMGISVNFDPKKPFTFSQFPQLNTRVKELFSNLSGKMLKTINDGTQHEWLLSASKNDALVQSILPTTKFTTDQLAGYMNRNLEALKEFQTRKSDGMNLSDRVWKQTEQFRNELELALDVGLAEGKSADALSRDVRGYLENPDMLFRRVRDARGVLHLSKAAKAYAPGQGVYRSSYKNAQRLTRSEINMSYRSADHERWQQLDFIVGFEVRRSNNHYPCVVCESLKGRYPKTFRFRQWHPQCRCNCISILASKSEISDLTDKILNDEDTSGFKSVNEITKMPDGWTSWISENKDRLLRAKSTPYFIADNFKDGKVTGGLKFALPIAKPAKTPVTPRFIPAKISKYETQTGIKVDRQIFARLNQDVPITQRGKGAFFDPNKNSVNLPITNRVTSSKHGAESVVYHEYGHALDWQDGLRKTKSIGTLMDKYRELFGKTAEDSTGSVYSQITQKLRERQKTAIKAIDFDAMEQIGAAADTLMSLNYNYGWGHSRSYFQNKLFKEAEFIAHAFENKFVGNPVFKEIMPDLYDEMIAFIERYLNGEEID